MRILVVDDEAMICNLFADAFGKVKIECVKAETGEVAVDLLKSAGPFDAAVIDKNLPGMNGIELVGKIRETDRWMTILVVTSYSSAESAEAALNLDVDGYAEKPFHRITAVVDRVLTLIDARKERLLRASQPLGKPRVAVIALGPVRDGLLAAIGAQADVTTAGIDEESVLAALGPTPSMVVIQSSLFGDLTPRLVERVRRRTPDAEVIVLASLRLGLKTLQKLIDLGVRRLVSDEGADGHAAVLQTLERIRSSRR